MNFYFIPNVLAILFIIFSGRKTHQSSFQFSDLATLTLRGSLFSLKPIVSSSSTTFTWRTLGRGNCMTSTFRDQPNLSHGVFWLPPGASASREEAPELSLAALTHLCPRLSPGIATWYSPPMSQCSRSTALQSKPSKRYMPIKVLITQSRRCPLTQRRFYSYDLGQPGQPYQ